MRKNTQSPHKSPFEEIKRTDPGNGGEFWSSRDFYKVLGYTSYQYFEPVIKKAKLACLNSGHKIEDHFMESHDMIEIGKGGQRQVETVLMSRYACYLAIQNADPKKEIVAQGQTYFAVQTRIQEIQEAELEDDRRLHLRDEIRHHNTQLADAARNAGVVEPIDYAIFQNHGYMGLYNGLKMADIHKHKGLKPSQKILDHMGSAELAANYFRATQAEEKLRRDGVKGKAAANATHFTVGREVRETIKKLGGTMPEDLPVADSIKEIEAKRK
jgi:DNA-damage-inducible protein D